MFTVILRFPLAVIIQVPIIIPVEVVKVINAPGSPVPIKVGVLSLVKLPDAGAVITGASGLVVSIINTVLIDGDTFMDISVWIPL